MAKQVSQMDSGKTHPGLKFMYWQKFCWDTEDLPIGFLMSNMMGKNSTLKTLISYLFLSLGLRKLFSKERILYLNLSDLYFKNRELEKGILILQEGIINFPKFIPLRFNLAIMYRNLGLIELSIKTHLAILLDDQFNSNSYYELSTMYNFSNHAEQLKTLLNICLLYTSPSPRD